MAIKTFKPTTPSRRHMTVSAFEGIDKKAKPERSLTEVLSKHAGRNSYGRITVRHRGGGNKRKYRIIDFKRDKMGSATVLRLEYDPNRSANIALIEYEDGERRYILAPNGLEYLQTIVFILVIAILVQLLENFLKKFIPALYKSLGVYLPLITTNCAVLGVALLNTQNDYNFIESVVYGITGGLGFLLAIFLFAAVREQLEVSGDNPKAFDGFPIALVTAGLMALAFMGFSGLKVW